MRRAFTLVELLVVMAIVSMLVVLGTTNLLGGQRKSTVNSTLITLVSDLREQRIKAMTGDTEGTGIITSYGIYFGANQYTVFRGSSYVPGAASNFVVQLPPSLTFTNVSFPGSVIVFTDGSGQVAGWSSVNDTLDLTDSDEGITKIIAINQYGVPTAIN